MNILFISPNSPFESVGGVERYLTNLIEYSKERTDFKVFLLVPTSKDSFVQQVGGVTIFSEKSIDLTKSNSAKIAGERAKEFAGIVENIIADYGINIICAENFPIGLPPAYSILLSIVAVRFNIPLVLRLHSFATSPLQTELINNLMWDKISCVSKSVTGDCFQKGANIDILSTDYLGVNTTLFNDNAPTNNHMRKRLHFAPNDKIVMTASRIVQGKTNILQAKGLVVLIQAFSKILRRQPDARLLIAVGKAPDRLKDEFNSALHMLEGYVKLHGIEEVTTIQAFTLDEMPDIYKAADVFVLASENETFGQVFVEAMSSGTPVVGTNVGGIPEVISASRNGYLISPNDVSALAHRIEQLLGEKDVANDFVQAAIRTISDKFTLEKQLNSFIAMLKEAAS
ncbi:MAG: glycosyltransferase family 4 protein [Candidatus Saccharimonadales bacterium]